MAARNKVLIYADSASADEVVDGRATLNVMS
jgi:hypothetical protein